MTSLYKLAGQMRFLFNEWKEGDPFEDYLELEKDLDQKLENICALIKNWEADKDAFKAESRRLTDEAKAIEGRIERLKNYVSRTHGEPWSNHVHTIRYSTSYAVVPLSTNFTENIPECYRRVKTSVEADKTLMKKDMLLQVNIDGWRLEERKNIQIK